MTDQTNRAGPVTARQARRIIRLAMTASMATVEPDSGAPYVSLVSVATAVDCTPIILLSRLAQHSANIGADPRISLLFDGTIGMADRLAGGRVTVSGSLVSTSEVSARQRFMARHPDAFYAGFGDFGWFRLKINRAVLVAGFGRVRKFSGSRLLLAAEQCKCLAEAQSGLLSTINGNPPLDDSGAWQLAGVDPEGLDLVRRGEPARCDFAEIATTGAAALSQIAQLSTIAAPGDPILDLVSNRTRSMPA